MRIDKYPRGPDTGLRAIGSHYTRLTKHGLIVQKWPRKKPLRPTPGELYTRTEWAYATSWSSNPEPMAYETARNLAKGTELLPRDILVMAMYGSLYEITLPDGTIVERLRDVAQNPQFILDLITTTNGSLIFRAPIGWIAITPGMPGQVLTFQNGSPVWENYPALDFSEIEFLLRSADPQAPAGRVIAPSNSIAPDYTNPGVAAFRRAALIGDVTAGENSNITTIGPQSVTYSKLQNVSQTARLLGRQSAGAGSAEELTIAQALNLVPASTRGDILFRGSTDWQRLPAGTSGQFLKTTGPFVDPLWADVSGGSGSAQTIYSMVDILPATSATLAAGTLTGSFLILPLGASVTHVQFWANSAAATAQVTPAIYDTDPVTMQVPKNLIATGPTVTGVVRGLNSIPLASPYTPLINAPLWAGVLVTVAGFDYPGFSGPVFSKAASSVPNPIGASVSYSLSTGAMPAWLYKPAGTIPPVGATATFDGGTANVTLSNGNLTATHSSAATNAGARSASLKNSGKWYFEVTIGSSGGNSDSVALITAAGTFTNLVTNGTNCSACYRFVNPNTGAIYSNNASAAKNLGAFANLSTIGVAVDLDNELVFFRTTPSGNWNGDATANPATATGGVSISNYSGTTMAPAVSFGGTGSNVGHNFTANFGATAFVGAVPSGFVAGWTV